MLENQQRSLKKYLIPLEKTGLFSPLFLDFAAQRLNQFSGFSSSVAGVREFCESGYYAQINRGLLQEEFKKQAEGILLTEKSIENIKLLGNEHTFTVTTGHQLCLATGPLYFIFKIISAINICEHLNTVLGANKFVPVYWMASEDHDAEEISAIHLFSKEVKWQTAQTGCVGAFRLSDLAEFLNELEKLLGASENAIQMMVMMREAYTKNTLAEATRFLVNSLFGKYGILILDGNSAGLKKQFKEEFRKDIFHQLSHNKVTETGEILLSKGYHLQVTPREINTFLIGEKERGRIVLKNGKFEVLGMEKQFTHSEMDAIIEQHPEKLSPNVVLRPLYQQKILPNAVYTGGPGELAYWLQYKAMFAAYQISFPVLIPRNSILYIPESISEKMKKSEFETDDLFKSPDIFFRKQLLKKKEYAIDEMEQKLAELYGAFKRIVEAEDATLGDAVEAELQKAGKGLAMVHQKLLRSLKRKDEEMTARVTLLFKELLPEGGLAERKVNFLQYQIRFPDFINVIKKESGTWFQNQGILVLREEA